MRATTRMRPSSARWRRSRRTLSVMSPPPAWSNVAEAGVDPVHDPGAVLGHLEHVAVVEHRDAVGADAERLGQLGVRALVARLAVDRREEAGADELQHQQQVAGAAVARDVDARIGALGDEVGVGAHQAVDDLVDGQLVARDRARRVEHRVARRDRHLVVLAAGDAAEGGHRLALAAGADEHLLVARAGLQLAQPHEGAGRRVEVGLPGLRDRSGCSPSRRCASASGPPEPRRARRRTPRRAPAAPGGCARRRSSPARGRGRWRRCAPARSARRGSAAARTWGPPPRWSSRPAAAARRARPGAPGPPGRCGGRPPARTRCRSRRCARSSRPGVESATAAQSGVEWVSGTNSVENAPTWTGVL